MDLQVSNLKRTLRLGTNLAVIGAIWLGPLQTATAAVWYVNAAAAGANDGTSWSTAFIDLQDALDEAQPGDHIWVVGDNDPSNGTFVYRPTKVTDTSVPPDPRTATFQLRPGVRVIGGFNGTEISSDQRNPTVNVTILSGDLDGDDDCDGPITSNCCSVHSGAGCDSGDWVPNDPNACRDLVCAFVPGQPGTSPCCGAPGNPQWLQTCVDITAELCGCLCHIGSNTENAYHVVTGSGVDDTAGVEDLIIEAGNAGGSQTAGAANPDFSVSGAGVYINSGSPKLVGCTIRANAVDQKGGAVYVKNGSPKLIDCILSGNSSGSFGGGVYSVGGNPTFTRCAFDSNSAQSGGGGVYATLGNATLTDCTFSANSAAGTGGGLYASGMAAPGGVTLTGCTFDDNTAGSGVGAILLSSGSTRTFATLTGCFFTDNWLTVGSGDGVGMTVLASDATLTDCVFSNNSSDVGGMRNTGGAIAIGSTSTASFSGCDFLGNSGTYGGALWVNASAVSLDDCNFEANAASSGGGGVHIDGAQSSATLNNCVFDGNEAGGWGGGVEIVAGTLLLQKSTLAGNYAESGGAIYTTKGANATVEDCIVENNGQSTLQPGLITLEGGGGYFDTSLGHSQSLSRCDIRNNIANNRGGGLAVLAEGVSGPLLIESCLITDNTSVIFGGGVSAHGLLDLRVVNCTIARNEAANGGGLWSIANSISIDNSIFWENSSTGDETACGLDSLPVGCTSQISVASDTSLRLSDIDGGTSEVSVDPGYVFDWQPTNIVADPLFVDVNGGNYRLSPSPPTASPCIDAGDLHLIAGPADLDRGVRVTGCEVDMGAYEYAVDRAFAPIANSVTTPMNRFISFVPQSPEENSTAIRVRLESMYRPNPAPPGSRPELLNLENQVRWVGPPIRFQDPRNTAIGGQALVSPLQCDPYYRDWSQLAEELLKACSLDSEVNWGKYCTNNCSCRYSYPNCDCDPSTSDPECPGVGNCLTGSTDPARDLLFVGGPAIAPDSVFEVQSIGEALQCGDLRDEMFTEPLILTTARWGDVAPAFHIPPGEQEPSALDVVNIVNSFKNLSGSPPLVFVKLQPGTPKLTSDVDALDIVSTIDAYRGGAYPYLAPTFCACVDEADIRADLNGDGHIDEDDDALEATESLFFAVNSDDDNGNGLEDYLDDGPVEGEDDLVEIRLSAKCPPLNLATAWWSISWNSGETGLKFWLTPDKSNGQGSVGAPIQNGAQNAWPLPTSVWLESVHSFDELAVTLTIPDSTYAQTPAGSTVSGTKVATLTAAAPCTPGNPRYHALAAYSTLFTSDEITSAFCDIYIPDSTVWLCSLQNFWTGQGLSAVYVGVDTTDSSGDDIWVQTGYAVDKTRGSYQKPPGLYAEVVYGEPAWFYRDYYVEYGVSTGTHSFGLLYTSPLLGSWEFYYDGLPFTSWNGNIWGSFVNNPGKNVQWASELMNIEDTRIGLPGPGSHCIFSEIRIGLNGYPPSTSPNLALSDVVFFPALPGTLEWGLQYLGPDSFEVWDKYP